MQVRYSSDIHLALFDGPYSRSRHSGIYKHQTALEATKKDFDSLFGVNVWGVLNTANAGMK